MVISKPKDVEVRVRGVKRGKLITPVILRKRLAEAYQGDVACFLTTGIFLWSVAHAVFEDVEMRGATHEMVPLLGVVISDEVLCIINSLVGGSDGFLKEEGSRSRRRKRGEASTIMNFERHLPKGVGKNR